MQIQLSYNTTRMQLESCPVRHPLHRRREQGGGPLDFTRSGSGQRVRQFVNGEARTDRDSDTGGEAVRRRPGRARTARRAHPPHTPTDGPAAARSTSRCSPGSAACEKRSALKTNRASTRKTLIHAPLGVTAHTPGPARRTPPISPPAPTPGSDRNHRRNPRHRASPTGGERGRPPHK